VVTSHPAKRAASESLQESTGAGKNTLPLDTGDNLKKSERLGSQERSKGHSGGKESQKGCGVDGGMGKRMLRSRRTRKDGIGEEDGVEKEGKGSGRITRAIIGDQCGQKRPRSDSQSEDIYDRMIQLLDGRQGFFKRAK
jgi:hypothetical protein